MTCNRMIKLQESLIPAGSVSLNGLGLSTLLCLTEFAFDT